MPRSKRHTSIRRVLAELWMRPPYRFSVFVVVIALLGGSYLMFQSSASSSLTFVDTFSGSDALITNEYATHNPACPKQSPRWIVTSGSLFRQADQGYSGKIDHNSVDCYSRAGTNSAVFRMYSQRNNFHNITFDMSFKEVFAQQANSYDGLHVWLRRQSEYALYAVSVGRLDNQLVVKKKVPGGPSNGGTYYQLGQTVYNPAVTAFDAHHHCTISIWDDNNGNAHIKLVQDSQPILEVVDNGVGGPVYHTGSIGVRGDNVEFFIDTIAVRNI